MVVRDGFGDCALDGSPLDAPFSFLDGAVNLDAAD